MSQKEQLKMITEETFTLSNLLTNYMIKGDHVNAFKLTKEIDSLGDLFNNIAGPSVRKSLENNAYIVSAQRGCSQDTIDAYLDNGDFFSFTECSGILKDIELDFIDQYITD